MKPFQWWPMARYIAIHTRLVWWGKADPTHQGTNHPVLVQIRPHGFNRTICRVNSSKRSSQTKCKLYPKDNPFCINISCISKKSVAKPFLKYNHSYMNHLNTLNLKFIFSNCNFEIFSNKIIGRSFLESFMHIENPHNVKVGCAFQDTATYLGPYESK